MPNKSLYWTITNIDNKKFLLAATNAGLCYVDCHEESLPSFKKWNQKHLPSYTLIEDVTKFNTYINELEQYFQGNDKISAPLDLYGTEFQLNVWKTLQTIPYGHVISYSDVAEMIGKPSAVRAVANAIGANPILIYIPCHRIIGKDGSLTGFRSGLNVKKRLLSLENVSIK